MTGETPNPLQTLLAFHGSIRHPEAECDFCAALAQVEALAKAARIVMSRMPVDDGDADVVDDLEAALVPFAAPPPATDEQINRSFDAYR